MTVKNLTLKKLSAEEVKGLELVATLGINLFRGELKTRIKGGWKRIDPMEDEFMFVQPGNHNMIEFVKLASVSVYDGELRQDWAVRVYDSKLMRYWSREELPILLGMEFIR